MDPVLVIVLVVLALLAVGALALYNGLVRGRLQVREGWSGVEVQLQRRGDLVPNLVETVKGYAAHERGVFENVTKARSQLQSAGTPGEAGQANNMLTQALRSLFAVAEAYPQLRASENFARLQEDLTDTESKIAFSRQFYNDTVLQYDNLRQAFPASVIANFGGFGARQYFEAETASREPVKVQF